MLNDNPEPPQGGYSTYMPTLAERFWRFAGWHSHYPELPEEVRDWPGWAATDVNIYLGFTDRLRLLLNGRLLLKLRHAADKPFDEMVTASSVELVRPGGP